MLNATVLPPLSSAAAAVIASFDTTFAEHPRGSIRAGNDRTVASRAQHFHAWLGLKGIQRSDVDALAFSGDSIIRLLAAYLWDVRNGHTIRHTRHPCPGTLSGYLQAAAAWISTEFQRPVPLYTISSSGASTGYHPILSNILQLQAAWSRPHSKKEPFTFPMFEALFLLVRKNSAVNIQYSLGKVAAVSNWTGLGVHTGSRLGEYGQSKRLPGNAFACVPEGPCRGEPIAFIRSDFTFFTTTGHVIPLATLPSVASTAVVLHILFRYDKSKYNHVIRKFRRIPNSSLCPILLSLAIFQRADALCVPPDFPLGVYRSSGDGSYRWIEGADVSSVMQLACTIAYPDKSHYLRIHIKRLVSHSNRVTAAVALKASGMKIPDIAIRLRWKLESVETYLRECFQDIGATTMNAIMGAQLLEAHAS
jgi:hypothetical protein